MDTYVLERHYFLFGSDDFFCDVGKLDDRFSVEVHHGGFLCGSGQNRGYLDEKVDLFDELDRRTFRCVFIDKMVTDLGYSLADHRMTVYWCRPGCSLQDGLVAINFERGADLMKLAAKEEKTLVVYVDHVGVIAKQSWDADRLAHSAQLPAVVSPRKVPGKISADDVHAAVVVEEEAVFEDGLEAENEEHV